MSLTPAKGELGAADDVRICGGIGALAADYDAFTIDAGCLGPGAAAQLASASAAGKKCVVMSGSADRAAAEWRRLEKLGVDRAHVAGVVTAGELAHDYLKALDDDDDDDDDGCYYYYD